MGTNYYVVGPNTPCNRCWDMCMRDDRCGLHFGKSSVGWVFLFRAYPDLDITTYRDWRRYMAAADGSRGLVNEYGNEVDDLVEFFQQLKERQTATFDRGPREGLLLRRAFDEPIRLPFTERLSYLDPEGFEMTARSSS